MKVLSSAFSVIFAVTLTALFGMVLGGAFEYAAGKIAPGLFTEFASVEQPDPIRVAIIWGAFGGVVCGGCLGAFAVAIKTLRDWIRRNHSEAV